LYVLRYDSAVINEYCTESFNRDKDNPYDLVELKAGAGQTDDMQCITRRPRRWASGSPETRAAHATKYNS